MMAKSRDTSASEYSLDPVLDFMRLLWSIEHALQRVSKKMDANLGITGGQRLVLLVIERFPGLSAKELAAILHLHPSTITGLLQRLEQKGLLKRTTDTADSRRVRLYLRERAKPFTRRRANTVESAVTQALSKVPPRRIRDARQVLAALAGALNEE